MSPHNSALPELAIKVTSHFGTTPTTCPPIDFIDASLSLAPSADVLMQGFRTNVLGVTVRVLQSPASAWRLKSQVFGDALHLLGPIVRLSVRPELTLGIPARRPVFRPRQVSR